MTTFAAENIIRRHLRVADRAVRLSLCQPCFFLGFGLRLDARSLAVSSFLAGLLLGLQASLLSLCLRFRTSFLLCLQGSAFVSLSAFTFSLFALSLLALGTLTFNALTFHTLCAFACGPLLRSALCSFLLGFQAGSGFLFLLRTLARLLFGAGGFFGSGVFTGSALGGFSLCLQAGSSFLLLLGALAGLLFCLGRRLRGFSLGFILCTLACGFSVGLDAGYLSLGTLACFFFGSQTCLFSGYCLIAALLLSKGCGVVVDGCRVGGLGESGCSASNGNACRDSGPCAQA